MRRRAPVVVAGAVLVALAVGGTVMAVAPGATGRACQATLVPAYAGPQEIRALAARDAPPALVIVNPDSGPGTHRRADFTDAVRRARSAGIRVLGYVSTAYGRRAETAVAADAERYRRWYAVDGVFLDETSHRAADLRYYEQLSRRLRGWSHPLVLNPGVVPARGYFALADVVVTFEGPYRDYAEALARQPTWLREIPAAAVAHLVYAASPQDALDARGLRPRARYVYLTSGVLPDPWGSVSGYAPDAQPVRCP